MKPAIAQSEAEFDERKSQWAFERTQVEQRLQVVQAEQARTSEQLRTCDQTLCAPKIACCNQHLPTCSEGGCNILPPAQCTQRTASMPLVCACQRPALRVNRSHKRSTCLVLQADTSKL